MILALAKGALGATVLLLLWVTIERAWGRIFAPDGASPREAGSCGGCLICTRRCAHDGGEKGTRGDETENGPGGSSCS